MDKRHESLDAGKACLKAAFGDNVFILTKARAAGSQRRASFKYFLQGRNGSSLPTILQLTDDQRLVIASLILVMPCNSLHSHSPPGFFTGLGDIK